MTRPLRNAPDSLTNALDASLRDIAAGAVTAAGDTQAEARRMLADFERTQSPAGRPSHAVKRAETA